MSCFSTKKIGYPTHSQLYFLSYLFAFGANAIDTKYPNITYLGIHKDPTELDAKFIEKNNIKFSFVNYTYGLNGLEGRIKDNEYMVDLLSDDDIEATMNYAVNNSEVCIAILHAGTEYIYEPTAYQKEQINKFIDLGADVVICMHPHVIEPFGIVTTANGNEGLVYYSLGNLLSFLHLPKRGKG